MSFLDKLKGGVTEAGNKAKLLVEINRLKVVNIGKQNEIDKQYKEIGKLVYENESAGTQGVEWEAFKERLEPAMMNIQQLKWEIEQNLQQIANLSDTRPCKRCGSMVAIGLRECPKCGHTFEYTQVEQEILELPQERKQDSE